MHVRPRRTRGSSEIQTKLPVSRNNPEAVVVVFPEFAEFRQAEGWATPAGHGSTVLIKGKSTPNEYRKRKTGSRKFRFDVDAPR